MANMVTSEIKSEQIKKISKLVEGVKRGEKSAFHALYKETWESAYYILLNRTENEEDASVLLNEVYTKVYYNIGKLENPMAFISWLNKIAHSSSIDYLRREQKHKSRTDLNEEYMETLAEEDEDFIPEAALERKENREMIAKAVNELPPAHRDVIFMHYYQNLSAREIGEILNIEENTVFKRLHDARKKIRIKLEGFAFKGVLLANMKVSEVLPLILKDEVKKIALEEIGASVWKDISWSLFVKPLMLGGAKFLFVSGTAGLSAAAIITIIMHAGFLEYKSKPVKTLESPAYVQTSPAILPSPNTIIEEKQPAVAELPNEDSVTEQYITENLPEAPPVSEEPTQLSPEEYIELTPVIIPPTPTGEVITEQLAEPIPNIIPQVVPPLMEDDSIELITPKPATATPAYTENTSSEQYMPPEYTPLASPTPNPVKAEFSFTCKIGEIKDESELIAVIAAYSGNSFDPNAGEVIISENNFDGTKPGLYKVELTATNPNGRVAEISAVIQVENTLRPEISIENPRLNIQAGTVVSEAEILEMSGVVVSGGSEAEIEPVLEGYETIDFNKAGAYGLLVTAVDMWGNVAPQKSIVVRIQNK